MALPSSGTISLNQVNVELKKTGTTKISMGDTAVRALAKKTSGAISMSDLRGKSSEVKYTNTTNRTAANIHTLMGSPTAATVYIFENTATISAASQGGWALQTGNFPAGSTLRIINRGHIRGGGGKGGNYTHNSVTAGGAGGSALVLHFPVTIDNTTGSIWGGGGGGGGGESVEYGSGGGGGGAGTPAGAGGLGGVYFGAAGTANAGGKGGRSPDGDGGGAGGAAGGAGAGGIGNQKTIGGRGGYSVQTNSNAVTWIAVGDRKGSVV